MYNCHASWKQYMYGRAGRYEHLLIFFYVNVFFSMMWRTREHRCFAEIIKDLLTFCLSTQMPLTG